MEGDKDKFLRRAVVLLRGDGVVPLLLLFLCSCLLVKGEAVLILVFLGDDEK